MSDLELRKAQVSRIDEKLEISYFECIILRKVMVYCKPFDDYVIFSFMRLYKYMDEKILGIAIFIDK